MITGGRPRPRSKTKSPQTKRRAAGGRPHRATAQLPPRPLPACRACGQPLSEHGQEQCGPCWDLAKPAVVSTNLSAAHRALRQARAEGEDPTHRAQARLSRSLSTRRTFQADAAWNLAHPDAARDVDRYRAEILPRITALPLSEMVQTTGLSRASCSLIRSGKTVPHRRHWEALAVFGETATCGEEG